MTECNYGSLIDIENVWNPIDVCEDPNYEWKHITIAFNSDEPNLSNDVLVKELNILGKDGWFPKYIENLNHVREILLYRKTYGKE